MHCRADGVDALPNGLAFSCRERVFGGAGTSILPRRMSNLR